MTSEDDEREASKAADNKNKMIALAVGIIIFSGIGWYVYDQEFFGENAPTTPASIAADKASCIEAVKGLTPYPEKTDFLPDVLVLGNDARRTVEGRVELADEKGNLFRHLFKCTMDNGTVAEKEAVRG
jgi:hypothetical protein